MEELISTILAEHGVKKNVEALTSALITAIQNELQKPKPRRESMYTDSEGINWYYCSRHGTYHKEEFMVTNSSRKTGKAPYCKASQVVWERLHRESQLLKQQAADAYMAKDTAKGDELMLQSQSKAEAKNRQETYENIVVE